MRTEHATSLLIFGAFALGSSAVGQERDSVQGTRLGGPQSVAEELSYQDSLRSLSDWVPFEGYFDWKKQLKADHGIAYGLSSWLLYQQASDATAGMEDDALGSIFRFQGSWEAVGRGTGSPGSLNFRLESRTGIGSFLSPSQLGGAVGAAALDSGFAYSDNFEADLAVLNWTQGFFDKRLGIAVGRLAFDAYQDAMAFQTFSRTFLNRSFVFNPTAPTTGIGALGAVAKGYVTDSFWLGGQIYDANAKSGEFDYDTFEEGEWLKSVEVGWTPSVAEYKRTRIQFTWWDKDARTAAGVRDGQGWLVSGLWQVNDRLVGFTRFGHSDGGGGVAARSAASVGGEWSLDRAQRVALGFGWAEPTRPAGGASLRDEYVVEASYMVQITPQFSVLPDVQLLIDPANNPGEDAVWVFGVRGLLAF